MTEVPIVTEWSGNLNQSLRKQILKPTWLVIAILLFGGCHLVGSSAPLRRNILIALHSRSGKAWKNTSSTQLKIQHFLSLCPTASAILRYIWSWTARTVPSQPGSRIVFGLPCDENFPLTIIDTGTKGLVYTFSRSPTDIETEELWWLRDCPGSGKNGEQLAEIDVFCDKTGALRLQLPLTTVKILGECFDSF